jgi:hypothetical protein
MVDYKQWGGEQQGIKLSKLKGAVAKEAGSKSYNEIFCDNNKIGICLLFHIKEKIAISMVTTFFFRRLISQPG